MIESNVFENVSPSSQSVHFNSFGISQFHAFLIKINVLIPEILSRKFKVIVFCVCIMQYADLLFGQIPSLQIEGKVLVQHGAIIRYLAREADMFGSDDDETTT